MPCTAEFSTNTCSVRCLNAGAPWPTARNRRPRHVGPVRHDAHGGGLGVPPPQLQSLQGYPAISGVSKGAIFGGKGDSPARCRSGSRRIRLPAYRRRHPPATADRLPPRRSPFRRMGLDSGQALPPSRFQIRAVHDLAVGRRPCGHRHRSVAAVPIARSSFPDARGCATSGVSSTNGTASAAKRACPNCGFMTFGIARPRSSPCTV